MRPETFASFIITVTIFWYTGTKFSRVPVASRPATLQNAVGTFPSNETHSHSRVLLAQVSSTGPLGIRTRAMTPPPYAWVAFDTFTDMGIRTQSVRML